MPKRFNPIDWFYQNQFGDDEPNKFICQSSKMRSNPICKQPIKPVFTLLDRFKKQHPNAPLNEDGIPRICPVSLGYENEKDYILCEIGTLGNCDCIECWNRPIKDEDTNHIPDVQKVGE